jgi:exo-1,4-beta-D-glucosaminidase
MKKLSFHLLLLFSFTSIQILAQSQKDISLSFPKVDKEPLSAIPAGAIVLYEDWRMTESAIIGNDGHKFSLPGYKTQKWYPTTVPATVLGVLVRNGIYPDPYIGLNNMKIPDASDDFNKRYDLAQYSHLPDKSNPWAKPYWFRKEFELPADYTGKTVWLNLDGLNYRADIWINGQLVEDANTVVGMFRRFRLNITRFAKPGKKNVMAIRIHPLDFPGDPVYAQIEGLHGNLGPNGGDGDILRNVTQYCTIGWDWVPAARDRNIGIWQHVSINASGPVVVADPAAVTKVNISKDTSTEVTVRFFVTNASGNEQAVKIKTTIQPDGLPDNKVTVNSSVTLKANSRREVILKPEDYPQLQLKNPHLWWPVTHGKQPLYRLEVSAYTRNHLSSTAHSKFGVRSLETFLLPSGGRAFKVNEKTIRLTGGAWIPDYLLSWSAQRYRDEARLMARGNATLVRVNGCGIMPPDVFFDACDKYGLLVWEDFSRTSISPQYRKDKLKSRRPPACDPKIYLDNMIDCISRMRGHPSVLLWCGSNEDAPQEDTGKALQNEILPKMDGTRIFLPSSSEQPRWSAIDIRTYTGGPWHMIRLPQYYKLYGSAKGFESRNEIGLTSVPTINAVAASNPDFHVPDKKSFPLNKSMGYHDAAGFPIKSLYNIMSHDIGMPSSIAEFLKWGDLYNNQTYRTIFEAANKARPRNEGTILWKSNAAWPGFNWQIYDWHLRPNAGYYTMKSACKPLHVQFSHDDGGIQVVSTISQKLTNAAVKAVILSADGKKQIEKQFKADVYANQTVSIDSVKDLINDDSLYFIGLDLVDQTGNIIDRTVTWTQKNTKWHELLSIPTVDVACKLIHKNQINGEIEYSLKIQNISALPVINLMAEITNGAFGKEILPAFWEDNALTMMPHETRNIKVKVRKALITKTPFLMIEGLNVNPAAWNVTTGKKDSLKIKINDFNIKHEEEKVYLNFSATQPENKGSRITTFPVKLTIDGKLYRYVSVAIKYGMDISGKITLTPLTPGSHRIQLGDLTKMINYSNKK